jgi:hypothetical protein
MKFLSQTYPKKYSLSVLMLHIRLHQFLTKFIQRVLSLPSDVALAITTNPTVEKLILHPRYQSALRSHQSALPELTENHWQIVTDLEREGVSVTTLEALNLPHTAQFFQSAKALAAELDVQSRLPAYRGKHTLTATDQQLLKYPEIFGWGVNETLLQIVTRYLQLPVAYDGLSYYFSVADGKEEGPRKWHRDKEDRRMVKICIYLNDVDEWGGPYECVYPHINTQLRQQLPEYQVLSHQQMLALLGHPQTTWSRSYPGTASTVILTDTARFYHRGKPPLHRNRAAIFFSYFSRFPQNPFFCQRSPLSQTQLVTLAEGLPASAREAILWRRSLPIPAIWIPKNQLKV